VFTARPSPGAPPTVRNLGNEDAARTLDFGALVAPASRQGGRLSSFGAGFVRDGKQLALADPVAAAVPVTFDAADELLRCGQAATLELLLHTGTHLVAGRYTGRLTLLLGVPEDRAGP